MDIISFLSSINKISLLAFAATLGFLSYEIYLLQKEKNKSKKPIVPEFNINTKVNPDIKAPVIGQTKTVVKHSNFFIILLIVLLVIFGAISALGFMNLKSSSVDTAKNVPTPQVELLTSSGVKLFKEDFSVLNDVEAANLKPSNTIVVGVATVAGSDIDWARIRINKLVWSPEDTTTSFDEKNKVFYVKHMIATGESRLKIEAQLHSKADGWLGE